MSRFLPVIILVSFLVSNCSLRQVDDEYLASLPEYRCSLSPEDSLDLDQFDLRLPSSLIKYDQWIVVALSQARYNLAAIDLNTKSKMDLIAVGRGPGEMLSGGNLHLNGTEAVLTESNDLTTVSLDMAEFEVGTIPQIDTVGVFKTVKNAYYLIRQVNGGFVSPVPFYNTFGGDAWYSLWDVDGYVGNSIPRPRVPGFEKASPSTIASFYGSDLIAVHPDKDRVCVSLVGMAAVSFSRVIDRELKEIKRLEYNEPLLDFDGEEAFIPMREDRTCFTGITSDREYVYLLYSGRKWTMDPDEIPSYEANHLVVYDWDGNYVARFYLSRNVLGIFVDEGKLYCLSQFPSNKLFIYSVPELS